MASGPPMEIPIVAPSGSALATASVPRLPLAPGLFSITKVCPSFCCRRSAISRATMSGVEPGPNGTTILTLFVGHSCAAAAAGINSAAANAMARVLFIGSLARSAMRSTNTYPVITGDLCAAGEESTGCPLSAGKTTLGRRATACLRTCHSLYCRRLDWFQNTEQHEARLRRGHGRTGGRTGVVSRRACVRDLARTARRRDRAHRGVALQGADVGRRARGTGADRLRLRALSGHRLGPGLVSTTMDELRHPAADVAGQHLRGRGLLPGPDLAHAQASHAGRGEDLGGRASHFERRSRFDRAVRLGSRLGGL